MSRSRNARSIVDWATFSAALVIALSNGEGTLRFSVTDDGRGSTPTLRATGPVCRASPIAWRRSEAPSRSRAHQEPAR